jgi:hypothetical protein
MKKIQDRGAPDRQEVFWQPFLKADMIIFSLLHHETKLCPTITVVAHIPHLQPPSPSTRALGPQYLT